MDKHLTAYLWDDAPPELRERVMLHRDRLPQMLCVVPARWLARAERGHLPAPLAALTGGIDTTWLGSVEHWGYVERFHQTDGSVLIVIYSRPRT